MNRMKIGQKLLSDFLKLSMYFTFSERFFYYIYFDFYLIFKLVNIEQKNELKINFLIYMAITLDKSRSSTNISFNY